MSPAKANSSEKTRVALTTNQPEIVESSEPKVPFLSRKKQLSAEGKESKRIKSLKKQQFYHSRTNQPMSSEEVLAGNNSEDEVDDETAGLEERERFDKIEEVSQEEKDYMCLWNIFVKRQRVLTDRQMPWACEEFTKLHKRDLMAPSNFLCWWRVIMSKLFKYGLISPQTIDKCNTLLRESEAEAGTSSTTLDVANVNEQQNMEADEEQE